MSYLHVAYLITSERQYFIDVHYCYSLVAAPLIPSKFNKDQLSAQRKLMSVELELICATKVVVREAAINGTGQLETGDENALHCYPDNY